MKLPSWQKAQRRQKVKRRFASVRKILGLIGLVLLLGGGIQFWRSWQQGLWNGRERLTLVFDATPVLVVSFDPEPKTLSLLLIPRETYIQTIHGYGAYRLGSIFQLGELEGYGGELLAGSLEEYLGTPVQAYANLAVTCPETAGQVKAVARCQKNLLTALRSLLNGNGQTNLTKWDLVRLWWGIRGVRFDKIRRLDLQETGLVKEITLPDETTALTVDPHQLDRLVADWFADTSLKREDLSIGVFNATDHPGLAQRAARLISNLGGRVVEVGDWQEKEEECQLRCQPSILKKETARRLLSLFHCRYGGEQIEEKQAAIILILGENYWRKLTEK